MRSAAIKGFAVTLGIFRSPLTPLKKGGTVIKVSLFQGDLAGSKTFETDKRTFQTSSTGIKVSLFKGDLEGSKTFETDKRTFQTPTDFQRS